MSNEEASEPTSSPAFKANFGRIIGERLFATIQDLVDWATQNREAYVWLSSITGTDPRTAPARDTQWIAVDRLFNAAQALLRSGTENGSSADQALLQLNQNIEKYFRKRWVIPADDPRSDFLKSIAQEDPSSAAMALGYFNRTTGAPSDTVQLAAYFRAMAFDLGLRESAEHERAALAKLQSEWQARTDELAHALADSRQEVAEWIEKSNAAYTAQLESFEKDQADRQSKFTGLLDKSAEELLAFKKAYNEELATRSAVSYWSSKAIMHRVLGGIAALATVIGGFLYFGIVVPNSFTNLVKHFNVGAEQPEWRAGIVVGLMLLGVWMGRIAVRLFFSQLHLAADASHRRVALLSYIALLNEPNAVTKDDRSLVLGTVFRPISDGIIRDDAMPPSPWELITRPPKGT